MTIDSEGASEGGNFHDIKINAVEVPTVKPIAVATFAADDRRDVVQPGVRSGGGEYRH